MLAQKCAECRPDAFQMQVPTYIHRLRKKIEKDPIRIATVRGLGYCLEKIPS
ncbi:winged helix-turn-helix domain-containing protein [Giesbergeria anulus]|uniref:Transcriptional regulatory protein, C terminal n=1 Tax=Giesbergeria anulus TaxID=180197 RepID=A0A1H9MH42_9BURK|nr:helix-turn-helix domain-containing protein [Giesbergeria anulus]SER22839.1 Transcriptional regulatory protein, C terminal [Giesbergeria anulus]